MNYKIFLQMMFLGQKVKPQQQNTKSNIKMLARVGKEPGTSCTQGGCVTSGPPSQLKVSIVVRLFNSFNAMGRIVNKQN